MNKITYDQVWKKVRKYQEEYTNGQTPHHYDDPTILRNDGKIVFLMKAIVDCINDSTDMLNEITEHIKKGVEDQIEKGNLKPIDQND